MAVVPVLYPLVARLQAASLTPDRVHACDLRALEMRVTRFSVNGSPATVHDWLQRHSLALLDLLCAIPYGTFIAACIAFTAFAALREPQRAKRFAWSFVMLNALGFIAYLLYPAAPPWYVHAHGCVVDLTARASAGPNLARVDGWLGVPYFAAMYSRSGTVFGAMPSLHCAYATLIMLDGWALFRWRARVAATAFALLMAFAAVYLDHHWILDVAAGDTLAVAVFLAVRALPARARGEAALPA
jgi:membrane-associated phospholipid phosphatase